MSVGDNVSSKATLDRDVDRYSENMLYSNRGTPRVSVVNEPLPRMGVRNLLDDDDEQESEALL